MAGLVIINLICMARNLTQEGSFDLWVHVHTQWHMDMSAYTVMTLILAFSVVSHGGDLTGHYSGNFPQQNFLNIPCIPAIVCGPLPCIVCGLVLEFLTVIISVCCMCLVITGIIGEVGCHVRCDEV